jgi:hypothetical protein
MDLIFIGNGPDDRARTKQVTIEYALSYNQSV